MATAWRHTVEFRAVAGVAAVVRALPQRASLWLGALIGYTFYLVDAPHRRLTIANLAAAFPNKRTGEIRSIARGVFAHFGSLLTELLRFSGLNRNRMLASVVFEGEDRVWHAHQRERRAVHHRPFRLLGAARDGPCAALPADRRRRSCARQPAAEHAGSRTSGRRPATA